MTTAIIAILKSFLIAQIISWGRYFLFRQMPDWNNPESVRKWILKYIPTLEKIAASTEIKWDDNAVNKLKAIAQDQTMFNIIYNALITLEHNTEPAKKNLRQRIAEKFNKTPLAENQLDEITEVINAIQIIKGFTQS